MNHSLRRMCLTAVFSLAAFAGVCLAPAAEPPETGLPKASPAELGLKAEPLAEIAPRMKQLIDEGRAAGVVTLVAYRGKVVHLEAVGLADVESEQPMKADSLFAIASMTKPITGLAVMILVDEGKLAVDDPVSKYIPAFAEAKLAGGRPVETEMTIRHLLTHTSGLGGSQENQGTLAETAELLARRELNFEPGSKWQYSPGLSVCGRIVEIVSGKPFDEFLAERIFRPLGMDDTTFNPAEKQQRRLATIYKPGEKDGTIESTTSWIGDVSGERTPNPSAGLFSTAHDLVRLYQMLLNGGELDGARILSEKSVAELSKPQTGELTTGFTPGCGWGLGCCVVREPQGVTEMLSPGTFGHGGAFGTQGWIDPKQEMIFILLVQRTGFGNGDASELRQTLQEQAVKARP